MTKDKLRSIFEYYHQNIVAYCEQLKPEQYDSFNISEPDILAHLRWMCKECMFDIDNNSNIEKCHRWLGYIQGELRAAAIFTISKLRDHSRSSK